MKARLRVLAVLSTGVIAAGLIPSMAASPASADEKTYSFDKPDDWDCTARGPMFACQPIAWDTSDGSRLASGTSVPPGTQIRLRFSAFGDPDGFELNRGSVYSAALFTIRGFVDDSDDCKYDYSMSHLTTGAPYSLPSGLAVYAEQVSFQTLGAMTPAGNVFPADAMHTVSTARKGGQYYCAMTGVAVQNDPPVYAPTTIDYVISSRLVIPILATEQPGVVWGLKPQIMQESVGVPFTYGSNYSIITTLGGDLANGSVASRLLYIGTAEADAAPCTGTLDNPRIRWPITRSGTRTDVFAGRVTVRSDAGRWLCAYQKVLNTNGIESSSPIAYKKIDVPQVDAPDLSPATVDVAALLRNMSSSTTDLRTALLQPQPDQAEVARLVGILEEFRRRAEEALRNGAVNGGNGGGAGNANGGAAPGGLAPQVIEELDRVDELIARGGGTVTPRSALETATGFDATITPLLPVGTPTASGMTLRVKSPKVAKKKRSFSVTASVSPSNIRGRLRMFLLYMDSGTPTLVHQRSGFVGNTKKKVKKFYINRTDKKGNYAILTAFEPTTPGQVGVATLTPLKVR